MPFIPDAAQGRFVPDAPKGPTEEQIADATMTSVEKGAEGVASLLSGAVAAPVAGLAGAVRGALPGPEGVGAETVRKVEDALTLKPKSKMGRNVAEMVAFPFEKLHQGAEFAGRKATDAGAPPWLATLLQTGIEGVLPMLAGGAARLKAPMRVAPEVEAARTAGLKLTPHDEGAGAVSKALAGFSGEPRLSSKIAQANQPAVNAFIVEDLGLPKDTPLSRDVLHDIREKEGKFYEAIRESGEVTTDDAYKQRLNEAIRDHAAAEAEGLQEKAPIQRMIEPLLKDKFTANAAVSRIKTLRQDAKKAFKANDTEMGHAAIEAADALEEVIGRNLEKKAAANAASGDLSGDPTLLRALDDFRNARVRIAKTYAADKAMNSATGDINPEAYAKMLEKHVPLSGKALELAETTQRFPRSLRKTDKLGPTGMTMGDLALHFMGKMARGTADNLTTGLMFARPATRSILASKPMQSSFPTDIAEILRQIQASKGGVGAEIATEERR